MSAAKEEEEERELERASHIRYFTSCLLDSLPDDYVSLDSVRLTVVHFCVHALDMLDALEQVDKAILIDHVYAMQIPADRTGAFPCHAGFIGSSFLGQPFGECTSCVTGGTNPLDALAYCGDASSSSSSGGSSSSSSSLSPLNSLDPSAPTAFRYMQGHLAMSYTSLATLVALGDDMSRVDKASLVASLKQLQLEDGSFRATYDGSECDMRFLYCACAISAMLGDWSGVDVDAATRYVQSCVTYEGGIALSPHSEAHGGSCYCGTAALALMGRLGDLGSDGISSLSSWCERRVNTLGGYDGRTNKPVDSCYSFWVGATLALLDVFEDTEHSPCRSFLLQNCQVKRYGGFGKTPGAPPDVLHSFYSLCWLSMDKHCGLRPIEPLLAICSDRIRLESTPGNTSPLVRK